MSTHVESPGAPPGAPRQSLAERLVADLLQLIQEGVVRPGAKLPAESELMQRFGVSRTVVREAISRLQASGIVRTQQGKGSFVLATPRESPFDLITPVGEGLAAALELLEFRTAIEVEAAGLAALRHSPDQLKQIAASLARLLDSAHNPGDSVDADFEFHLRIAWATGNGNFPHLLQSLGHAMLAVPPQRLSHQPATFDVVYTEHAEIHAAIERGDQLSARAAMRRHLVNSGLRLSAAGHP